MNEVSGETFNQPESEELSRLFYEQEAGMKKELREATKEIDLSTKERISITGEIKEREEELKKETEKFKITVLTQMDNWIEQSHDKGNPFYFVSEVFSFLAVPESKCKE